MWPLNSSFLFDRPLRRSLLLPVISSSDQVLQTRFYCVVVGFFSAGGKTRDGAGIFFSHGCLTAKFRRSSETTPGGLSPVWTAPPVTMVTAPSTVCCPPDVTENLGVGGQEVQVKNFLLACCYVTLVESVIQDWSSTLDDANDIKLIHC